MSTLSETVRKPPAPGSAPVRRIGKSGRAINGTLVSVPGQPGTEFESALERDFYTRLHLDPAVERVVAQPVRIAYVDEGHRKRHYTPDVLVHYLDGRRPGLFEIKYVSEVREKRARLRPVFQAAQRYARQQGWTFTLATELVIRRPDLATIQFLRPYLRRRFPPGLEGEVLAALSSDVQTPRQLLATFAPERLGELLPVVWKLVARRALPIDLGVKLTLDSPFATGGTP